MWTFLAFYLALFTQTGESRPLFVASTPPAAMIVSELAAGRAEVRTLLQNGASPHTFDPKPSDLALVSKAKALVYVGPELESWAAKLHAKEAIALLPFLPVAKRLPSGGDDHDHGLYDPHFWSDPQAVREVLPGLADRLCAVDAAGCATYKKNAAAFAQTLTRLDAQATARLAPQKGRPVLSSHPFFQYFFARYGAAQRMVVAQSCEHEPTPRALGTIFAFVAKNAIKAVYSARQDSQRAAELVAEQTGTRTVVLDGLGTQEMSYEAWFTAQTAKIAGSWR